MYEFLAGGKIPTCTYTYGNLYLWPVLPLTGDSESTSDKQSVWSGFLLNKKGVSLCLRRQVKWDVECTCRLVCQEPWQIKKDSRGCFDQPILHKRMSLRGCPHHNKVYIQGGEVIQGESCSHVIWLIRSQTESYFNMSTESSVW